MREKHTPQDDFVERLEGRIGREVHQRNSTIHSTGWLPRIHLRFAVAMAAIVIVSMAVGGAVVAAAYQAQSNDRRDLLVASYVRRADLARQRLGLAQEQLKNAAQQAAIGVGSQESIQDARVKVAEAEAAVKSLDLQIEEIRLTAREPLNDVSAPVVSGRDFVGEHWTVEMSVPVAALEAEQARLKTIYERVAVGMANKTDYEVSKARVLELEAGVDTFRRRLDIRHQFLKGEIDAAMADLRLIEAETDQRRKALEPRLESAKLVASNIYAQVNVGMAQSSQLSEARIHVMELELDMAKLDADLVTVRKQIDQRRGK